MPEKWIRKYYDDIFRYCYHHVGNRTTAEDLCQDTFVSFIEHYGQYRSMGKMKNYLYAIAGNKCRDYYRKKAPLFVEEVPEQETGERMEETVVIRQMVMGLPEEFREAVVLRYFHNLKYADIAAVLHISLSLAKYRVKKGVGMLAVMEEEGGAHGTRTDGKKDRKGDGKGDRKSDGEADKRRNGKPYKEADGRRNGKPYKEADERRNGKLYREMDERRNGKPYKETEGRRNGKLYDEADGRRNGKPYKETDGRKKGKTGGETGEKKDGKAAETICGVM